MFRISSVLFETPRPMALFGGGFRDFGFRLYSFPILLFAGAALPRCDVFRAT